MKIDRKQIGALAGALGLGWIAGTFGKTFKIISIIFLIIGIIRCSGIKQTIDNTTSEIATNYKIKEIQNNNDNNLKNIKNHYKSEISNIKDEYETEIKEIEIAKENLKRNYENKSKTESIRISNRYQKEVNELKVLIKKLEAQKNNKDKRIIELEKEIKRLNLIMTFS